VGVHYLGHAAFILEFGDGTMVLTDYGESNAYGLDSPVHGLGGVVPDIVTQSHEHADHAGGEIPEGVATTLTGEEVFSSRGLTITPIPTHERSLTLADNSSFLFDYRGLKILHLGDCQGLMVALRGGVLGPGGSRYSREQVGELIRSIYPDTYDLVLLPIGYTDNIVAEAAEFAGFLDARVMVPMHYWSEGEKTEFLERMGGRLDASGEPYDSRETGRATLRVVPTPDSGEGTQVLGLTPAPFPRM
jgi:L-ascorbate metabolism protein UlaG (beta-lactamase superfamily)